MARAKKRKKSSRRFKIKTRSVRKVAKKRKSVRRNTSILGKLNRPLIGAAGVVAYESFISPMIPVQGIAKDLLELGAGLFMQKKRGIIGATGATLVALNSYQLINRIKSGEVFNLNFSGSPATTNASW